MPEEKKVNTVFVSAWLALAGIAFCFMTTPAPGNDSNGQAVANSFVQPDVPIKVESGMGQTQTSSESRKIFQWATEVFLNPNPMQKRSPVSELDRKIPFSFDYGGQNSSDLLPRWNRTITNDVPTNNVRKYIITYTDKRTKLEVRCELKMFDDFPAVEWVLFFKNSGAKDAPIIQNILPLDVGLSIPIYHVIKKHCVSGLSEGISIPGVWMAGFDIREAKYAESEFQFYNIEWGKTKGAVFAAGWSGALEMGFQFRNPSLTDSNSMSMKIQAGQDPLKLKLYPGEEIRTPRILLMYWEGQDWLRGNNLLRQLLITHYLPRYPDGTLKFPPVVCTSKDFAETEQGVFKAIDRITEVGANAYWLDAARIRVDRKRNNPLDMDRKHETLIHGFTGSSWEFADKLWDVVPAGYPNGFKPVSDACHKKGRKLLLWYDEDVVEQDTELWKSLPKDWLLARPDQKTFIINLGNTEARRWRTDYVSERIEKWGIDIYHNRFDDGIRQALSSDIKDRSGAIQNHYISGFYDFLDELLKRHPNLMFAYSVGWQDKRVWNIGSPFDLEMISRAYPVWPIAFERSADAETTQVFNAKLNYFIPVYSVLACFDSNKAVKPEFGRYMWRSYSASGTQFKDDLLSPSFDVNAVQENISEIKMLRPLLLGDYYPLLNITGSDNSWWAYQFHRKDLEKGFVMVFRRSECKGAAAHTIGLEGLNGKKKYKVIFKDTNEEKIMSRTNLRHLKVEIDSVPGSSLILYEAQENNEK